MEALRASLTLQRPLSTAKPQSLPETSKLPERLLRTCVRGWIDLPRPYLIASRSQSCSVPGSRSARNCAREQFQLSAARSAAAATTACRVS